MVCRLDVICARPLDAVWIIDTPSFAFDTPWFRPLICVVIRVEIARPAASSAALLMRLPEDRRVMACERALCEPFRFCCATSELILLLIPSMEDLSNKHWIFYRHRQRRNHSIDVYR